MDAHKVLNVDTEGWGTGPYHDVVKVIETTYDVLVKAFDEHPGAPILVKHGKSPWYR